MWLDLAKWGDNDIRSKSLQLLYQTELTDVLLFQRACLNYKSEEVEEDQLYKEIIEKTQKLKMTLNIIKDEIEGFNQSTFIRDILKDLCDLGLHSLKGSRILLISGKYVLVITEATQTKDSTNPISLLFGLQLSANLSVPLICTG